MFEQGLARAPRWEKIQTGCPSRCYRKHKRDDGDGCSRRGLKTLRV
jgi:hypothetical protein